MNFLSRQKAYVKMFAVYALCLMAFQNVLGPIVQFASKSVEPSIASVEQVEASGVNAPSVYISCDVNEDGTPLTADGIPYNNSYMCGQEVKCYGHVSNWNNPVGNNVNYTSSFTIAGGTLVPGSVWTYNDPAFNHGKPGSVTCTATSTTIVTCNGTAGTDQDLSGVGETQFESVPDMGFKVLLNACDNNCEEFTINANMNATLTVAPNSQSSDTHSYSHGVNGCNAVACPSDSDYTATTTVNGSSVTVAGTCDATKFSTLSVAIPGQTTQTFPCTANRTRTFNNLAGNLTATVTATPIQSGCNPVVKNLDFSFGDCTDDVELFVNAPTQTNSTSLVITGTIAGNWSVIKMNGVNITLIPGATIANGTFSVPVTLTPGQSTTFTFVAIGIAPCGDKTVVAQISCNPTSCVVNQGDMNIDYSNLNGTSVTVGGYCDSSKINQVKLDLTKAGLAVGTPIFVDCINDAWEFEYTNLQQASTYVVRATSVNKPGCNGIIIKNTTVNISAPLCEISETDLTIATPIVVTQTGAIISGTCNHSEFSQVKIMVTGPNYSQQFSVACTTNNTWSKNLSGLTPGSQYSVSVLSINPLNGCTGGDNDSAEFITLGLVCTIDENDLIVNQPVVNGTSVTVGGTCNKAEYSTVKVELMMGSNVSAVQNVVCSNTNTWIATFNNLTHNTAYTIKATTQGNVNTCTGQDVDTVNFNCGGSVCTDAKLTVNAPVQTSATGVLLTGTVSGSYSQVKVNGTVVSVTNGYFQAIITLVPGQNTVVVEAIGIDPCKGDKVVKVIDCHTPSVCMHNLQTGVDLTITTVTTNGMTGTIVGTYNSQYVGDIYVIYNGVKYNAVKTNSVSFLLIIPGLPAGTTTVQVIASSLEETICPTISMPASFTCGSSPVCMLPIVTGDYSANVTTAATTATIFGSYNVNTIANVYVVYSGNTYPVTMTNGTYTLTINNVPVNSAQSAVVYFTAKDALCPSPKSLTVNFTCNQGGGGCNYPISDILLNYSSGQVVTTSGITLSATVVGYGKTYSINGITGDVVHGTFSRNLALTSGANTFVIQVISQDQMNCVPMTKTIVLYYQPTTTPSVCSGLAFSSLYPTNNTSTYDGTIVIQGTVNIASGTRVIVAPTNAELTVTSGGAFSGLFSLNVGTQTFTVKAINTSGCEVSQTITVTRNSSGGGGGGTIYIGGGSNYCGDGVKRSTEQCDDGNNRNGDGCDMNCYLESTPKQASGSTSVINKKVIAKKLPRNNATLQLGTVIAPVVLPKTGGFDDVLTVLLQLLQSLIA